MHDWLAASANANPQKIALIADSFSWTYAALDQQVSSVGSRLTVRGVAHGQHVGVLLPNCVEYVLLIHALARLGAVLVPLNVRLSTEELIWQAQWADCVAVICNENSAAKLDEHRASGLRFFLVDEIVGAILGRSRKTPHPLIPSPSASAAQTGRRGNLGAAPLPVYVGEGRLTSGEQGEGDNELGLERVQSIVFTSGTTGRPKGAQITFGNHFYSAAASSWRIGVLPEDRWLLVMPLYHVGGMSIVFRSALYGTAIVLQNGFEVERVWQALETQGITLISVVPTMLHRMLEARPGQPFPSPVRLVLVGGAAATPALVEQCVAREIPVSTTYGLTEACSQVATILPEEVRDKPGSVGKPLLFTSVRIVDEHGDSLSSGQQGEIVVSGPTVMAGYYKQPDDHALQNGALFTGDLGCLDDDGDLWIVQRRSDLIVTGGENVYPAEVENVLRQHPDVAEVVVVGIPSEEWGQQVTAAVVFRQDRSASSDELDAFCRQQLAAYKCPRRYTFVSDLPQTASGKISRRLVAKQMASA